MVRAAEEVHEIVRLPPGVTRVIGSNNGAGSGAGRGGSRGGMVVVPVGGVEVEAAVEGVVEEGASSLNVKGSFKVGDQLQAKCKNWPRYYSGKVTVVHDDGTYDVHFDDGETVPKVTAAEIKTEGPLEGSFPATRNRRGSLRYPKVRNNLLTPLYCRLTPINNLLTPHVPAVPEGSRETPTAPPRKYDGTVQTCVGV
jgi:hypothetical protein